MDTTKQRIEALKQKFDALPGWEERYQYIIQLGKTLPEIDVQLKIDDNKIKGCQSQVWLSVKLIEGDRMHFQADSDAMIVKGLIALLLGIFQDLAPDEVLKTDLHFLKSVGLESHLSPSRANGFYSMIKQIQYYATAFSYLLSQRK